MVVVSIFKIENPNTVENIVKQLDKKKANGCWISAQRSDYVDNEVFIQYWYNEDIEECIKRSFSEQDAMEIYSILKRSGRTIILKRIYCFVNTLTNTLEVYRWKDDKTEEIVAVFEKLLGTRIIAITLKPEELQRIYSEHSIELNQAMFKNVDGLLYDILKGSCLENNQKFNEYMNKFQKSLRVISFRPRIRFLNGNNRYQVTINGDKGTIKFSEQNNGFKWRPRFEIRQMTFVIASTLGMINC